MIRIDLKPVLVIDLEKIAVRSPEEIIRRCVEFGHAVGNQHWPAIVKGTKVYIPLTVDKKVMMSVMETHRFEDVTYEFQAGRRCFRFYHPTKSGNFSVAVLRSCLMFIHTIINVNLINNNYDG